MQCLYLDWNKKKHQKNIFRKMNVNVKFIKLFNTHGEVLGLEKQHSLQRISWNV